MGNLVIENFRLSITHYFWLITEHSLQLKINNQSS